MDYTFLFINQISANKGVICFLYNLKTTALSPSQSIIAFMRRERGSFSIQTWPRTRADWDAKYSGPTLAALFYSSKLQGAAVSLFNLGQTDGDSVCGDCINISSPGEGGSFGGTGDEPLQRGRAGEEETKDGGQKLRARWFFLITASHFLFFLLPLSPSGFPFLLSLFITPHSPLFSSRSITKDGCRLVERSHVVESGSSPGERAEGKRLDSASPPTGRRIIWIPTWS